MKETYEYEAPPASPEYCVQRLTALKEQLDSASQEVRFHISIAELAKKHGKDTPTEYDADLRRKLAGLRDQIDLMQEFLSA